MHGSLLPNAAETASVEGYDTAKAVKFLTALVPAGRLALASIIPDGATDGRTFDLPHQSDALATWIEARQGARNLYFSLNEPQPAAQQTGGNGRLREADIASLRGVVVDVDPLASEETKPGGAARERARLEALAAEMRDTIFDPPTAIVNSGSGLQAIWCFAEPIPVSIDAVREVKAHAKGLGALYGSDKVQSIEHLFRVPYTVNLPDARKRARGRQPCLSTVLHLETGPRAWSLAALGLLAAPIYGPELGTVSDELDLSGALAVLGAPDDLRPELKARLAAALARSPALRTCLDPELAAAQFMGDRSSRDYATAAALVEEHFTDPVEIASVVAAFCPEKVEQRGEGYLVDTVRRALKRVQPRKRPEDWFDAAAAADAAAREAAASSALPTGIITVSGRIDPSKLPVRKWLVHPRLPLGTATLAVGEPAISKSTFMLRDALIVATGREDILRGKDDLSPERLHRTGPVIVHNAEDEQEEMQKRLLVTQAHYDVGTADMKHAIHLWSGVDAEPLVLMRRDAPGAPLKRAPGADKLANLVRQTGAVLVFLDPLVSLSVGAEENSTEDMNALLQLIANLAAELKASFVVVHHTAKATRHSAGDMGAGRGAFSIVAKVRSQFTLCQVDSDDAEKWGVAGRDVFRLDYGKSSYGRRPTAPLIFERLSAPVENGRPSLPTDAASGYFPTSAEELLQLHGDTAPVLDFIKVGTEPLAAAEAKAVKVDAKRLAVANAVYDVIGGLGSCALGGAWAQIGARMKEAGASKARSRGSILALVKVELGATGVPIERNGQLVIIQARKEGLDDTSPWRLFASRPATAGDLSGLSNTVDCEDRQDGKH